MNGKIRDAKGRLVKDDTQLHSNLFIVTIKKRIFFPSAAAAAAVVAAVVAVVAVVAEGFHRTEKQ